MLWSCEICGTSIDTKEIENNNSHMEFVVCDNGHVLCVNEVDIKKLDTKIDPISCIGTGYHYVETLYENGWYPKFHCSSNDCPICSFKHLTLIDAYDYIYKSMGVEFIYDFTMNDKVLIGIKDEFESYTDFKNWLKE